MENRPIFRTSSTFETVFEMNHDQNRNHIQSFVHLGSTGIAEGAPFALHMENMLPGDPSSNSNFSLRSNGYFPSSISTEPIHPQVPILGPSYPPFQHPSAARSFIPTTQNYADCLSSSSQQSGSSFNHHGYLGQGYEEGNSSTGRGPYKRKRTSAPAVYEGVSGYYSVGSTSDVSGSSLEKPNSGSQHWPWEVVSVTPGSRGSTLSISGEASQRNVRSRSAVDLDVNRGRAHALTNPPCYSHTGRLMDRSSAANVANLAGSSAENGVRNPMWGPNHLGRILAGPSASSYDTNQFRIGSGGSSSSMEIDTYRRNLISSRNPVTFPQNSHFSGSQVRGRSSYMQRAVPVSRVTRGYQRLGHVAAASERVLQSVPEGYPPYYSRPPAMIGLRNSERSGRLRIPYQRSNPLSVAADSHDRLGFTLVDHSTIYDSRALLDQHRDMRLDVDNMSYEELLALEERIGTVNTGLSEDLMSKCLKETVHYPSDQSKEDSSCVICLEEYSPKDVVATVVNCSHDYHSSCIKKWLSMKKVCPICKAAVLSDN